ncbi:MAG: hypothetical protein ACKO2L_07350 [Planctomycetaceae bacterium]
MLFNKRNRNRRLANPCPLEIQSLETRQLLAADLINIQPISEFDPEIVADAAPIDGGTVAVSVSRFGDITLTGDAKPNTVNIQIQGSTVLVEGAGVTSFRVPGAAAQPLLEVPRPTTVRSITINLAGGADTLNVTVASDTTVTRDIVVNLGAGNDSLVMKVVNADLKVNQSITLDLAAGDDFADVFVADAASIVAGRDISIRGGAGDDYIVTGDDDYVDLDNLYSQQNFNALEDNSEIPLAQRIRANRDASIDLGAGNDRLTLLNLESGRNLSVAAAAGIDTIVASNLRSARNTGFTDAESLALQNFTAVGNLNIRGSNIAAKISLDRVSVNRLDVALGLGNDELTIGETVTVKVASSINGGPGNNGIYTAKPQPKITVRRSTRTLSSQQSLDLLVFVLDRLAGNLRSPDNSNNLAPAQLIVAD